MAEFDAGFGVKLFQGLETDFRPHTGRISGADQKEIKGLGINLFDSGWNSLIQIPNFIGYINTPILKATKGNQTQQFYNEGEFSEWKKNNDIKGWNVKYYKGLGTSTGKEFKEYFKEKKIIYFNWDGEQSSEYIDMIFNKKRSDDRKDWLGNYDRELYLDTNKTSVTYKEFIDKEFIHFSKYDNDRSIPNILDGLKISQRKILFALNFLLKFGKKSEMNK